MIQHMNLVFQANGLSVGEGAFLMACANHTDDRGYVIAHMQQLADEAHMSLRSARDQKARLEKKKLVKAAPRFNPKNGAQIANLFRINLDLLRSMKRQRKDYGPTLVEELSFDEAPKENPSSAPPAKSAAPLPDPPADPPADLAPPPADLAPPPADLAGTGGAKSAPLLLPSSAPSSLSPAAGHAEAPVGTSPNGEREREASPERHHLSAADVPQQRARSDKDAAAGDRIVAAYAAALGRPVLNGTRAKLERQAVELLAQGLPEGWLADRARELAERGWSDLAQHAERSTAPLPSEAPAKGRPGLPEWCGECGHGTPAARLNPRFRTLGELGSGEKCPRCHPARVAPMGA
ncbi:hypothetical protein ACFCYB_37020 [Streptomyces sp. NPDC056309]|uniref:hypothetical protein n=1 Tax=unclassified Streptomyces TaxID=2593676 RepID=UPI0035DC8591